MLLPFPSAGRRIHLLAPFAIFLSSVLFATKSVIIKHCLTIDAQLNGVTLLALRMLAALPFYLLILGLSSLMLPKQALPATGRDWVLLAGAALAGYYGASVLDFIGLQYISASLERLILFLYPTLTVIFSALLYRQRLGSRVILALVLSYGGTLLVTGAEGLRHQGSQWLTGVALVFCSAIAYASYLLFAPRLIRTFGSWRFNSLAMILACLAALLHYILAQPAPFVRLQNISAEIWLWGGVLGIFATVIPTTLLAWGMKTTGSAQAALISSISPVLTLALAVIFLHEPFGGLQLAGSLLNIGGVLLITLRPAGLNARQQTEKAEAGQPRIPKPTA